MLDKLLLNNTLVSNKKKVYQVRVLCINKLVQKLRKLTEQVEKHPEEQKFKEKLRKTTETLACIKKINYVELLRKALVFEGKPEAVITNGSSSPEEIAEASIISHKIITDLVASIKELLNLNDSNPGWQETVLEVSKRKQKFMRTDMKREKRAERKQKNALTRNRLQWMEENKSSNEEVTEDSNDAPTEWQVEKLEGVEQVEEETEGVVAKKVKIEKQDAAPVAKKVKTETAAPSVAPAAKKVKLEKVQKKIPVPKEPSEDEQSEEEEEEEMQTTVDPFFLTNSGQKYISTAVVDRTQAEPLNDGLVRKERRANLQRHNKHGRNNKNFGNKNFEKRPGNGNKNFEKRSGPGNKNFERPNISSFKDKKAAPKQAVSDEKVHPSWAAKQKQKGIKEFSGKKITFGDDGADAAPKKPQKSFEKKSFEKSAKPANTGEKLHPSWEAKQKQKPAITKFEGKKIVFDE